MHADNTLKTRQISLFFIALMPVAKFFMMPSIMAGEANEDLWMSCLINVALDFVTLLAVVFATRNAKTDFFGLLEGACGKRASKIVLLFYAVFFILKAFLPIAEQKDYVVLTMYLAMPKVGLFLPFFLVIFYLCAKKLRVIGRIADVLWVSTVLGYLLLMALSIPNLDMGALLPGGANGFVPVIKGAMKSLNWFGDCAYFLFFIGRFKREKKTELKILGAYAIAAVMVLLFVIFFYASFSSIAVRKRFALTEISKYATVINNIGRFDYLAIFLILFSSVFSLTLPLYFANMILERVYPLKRPWMYPLFLAVLMLTLTLTLSEKMWSIEYAILNYAPPIFILFNNALPIIFSLLKKGGQKNEIKKD